MKELTRGWDQTLGKGKARRLEKNGQDLEQGKKCCELSRLRQGRLKFLQGGGIKRERKGKKGGRPGGFGEKKTSQWKNEEGIYGQRRMKNRSCREKAEKGPEKVSLILETICSNEKGKRWRTNRYAWEKRAFIYEAIFEGKRLRWGVKRKTWGSRRNKQNKQKKKATIRIGGVFPGRKAKSGGDVWQGERNRYRKKEPSGNQAKGGRKRRLLKKSAQTLKRDREGQKREGN